MYLLTDNTDVHKQNKDETYGRFTTFSCFFLICASFMRVVVASDLIPQSTRVNRARRTYTHFIVTISDDAGMRAATHTVRTVALASL